MLSKDVIIAVHSVAVYPRQTRRFRRWNVLAKVHQYRDVVDTFIFLRLYFVNPLSISS